MADNSTYVSQLKRAVLGATKRSTRVASQAPVGPENAMVPVSYIIYEPSLMVRDEYFALISMESEELAGTGITKQRMSGSLSAGQVHLLVSCVFSDTEPPEQIFNSSDKPMLQALPAGAKLFDQLVDAALAFLKPEVALAPAKNSPAIPNAS